MSVKKVGFDLDGTLAYYDRWRGVDNIGFPIAQMCLKLQKEVALGSQVSIFTARVSPERPDFELAREHIQRWCRTHLSQVLPVTSDKGGFHVIYDDRTKQVVANTGKTLVEHIMRYLSLATMKYPKSAELKLVVDDLAQQIQSLDKVSV